MRHIVMFLMLLTMVAPVRAQLEDELRREEVSRELFRIRLRDIGAKLRAFDAAGARADLQAFVGQLTQATYPGDEMRRRVTSALSMLGTGAVRETEAELRVLFVETAPAPNELTRPEVGLELRRLGRSAFEDTLPNTLTAAIGDLRDRIEKYPSFYGTWTRRQLEQFLISAATRNRAQAQRDIVQLVRGIGQGASDLEWRGLVETEWTKPLDDESTRPQIVLAALRAFPAGEIPPPAGSPFDHWLRLHGAAIIFLLQGNAEQQARARLEWRLSNEHLRDF